MPIIEFKPEDAMGAITMDAGVYPCHITLIDGPKASSTQKSISYFTTFQITGGKYQSKTLQICFNSGTSAPNMMGTMQFIPTSAFLQVEAAITNKKVEVAAKKLNTDDLLNKPFCIQVVASPDGAGGKLINMIINFLPVGADKTANSATPF